MKFMVVLIVFLASLTLQLLLRVMASIPTNLTYVVTMSANEKTAAQIDDFSAFYHALVEVKRARHVSVAVLSRC